MLKKILIAILAIALVGGGIVYYKLNQKAPTAATQKVDVTISAEQLAKEYAADEKTANTKYLDKNIEVTGNVTETEKNQDGFTMVTLETGDPVNTIQCTLMDKTAAADKGKPVTIKGLCSGYNMGVALRECVIKK